MLDRNTLRWAGLLLAAGISLIALAAIFGAPFEQATVSALREAIAARPGLYIGVNLLVTAGFMSIVLGFGTLALSTPVGRAALPRQPLAGLGLLVAAAALWMLEVVFRFVAADSGAGIPVTGASESGLLGMPLGTGFNPVFLAFLAAALAGLAVLVWGLGDEGVLPRRLARVGALLVVLSGGLAVRLIPWVGAVEHALFYPLVLVVLPTAAYLLLRRQRRLARRPLAQPFDAARG